ncbi:type-F conjugative transfer system protein TrbI (plasmid) [Edwardsiella hoshinae]|uniref:Type-F conjugative transfer system protein TrbI n=3 Tax=Hafniaceae TaxID=1903412 RepID=A0A2A7U846_EDWTA|nr:type-F conjugative transfer system protein TrbI [Edwardsiella tarda]QPR26578.1 type-F conjugative transfer system protein TrbI [Edwardsiella hoshinae]STE53314.1 conjugal transfer protein TrbI [Edwardsiella hoshinae]
MTSPKMSQGKRCLGWGVLFASLLLVNAAISWGICHYSAPRAVAFDMKQTVDAFFDSASQKKLSEAQTRALSDRFNSALEQSLQTYQQQHHVLILVAPAVVQGAPDITRVIQQDIARRMREAS